MKDLRELRDELLLVLDGLDDIATIAANGGDYSLAKNAMNEWRRLFGVVRVLERVVDAGGRATEESPPGREPT